jgi:hypothetical protein
VCSSDLSEPNIAAGFAGGFYKPRNMIDIKE